MSLFDLTCKLPIVKKYISEYSDFLKAFSNDGFVYSITGTCIC